MSNTFGMQILKTLQYGCESVNKLFLLIEKLGGRFHAFAGLSLKWSHGLFVKNASGEKGGLEQMIMEKVGLFNGYNWGLKILVEILGSLVDHENVVGLKFKDC